MSWLTIASSSWIEHLFYPTAASPSSRRASAVRHGGRVPRRRDVDQAHCEERLGEPVDERYRSYEVDLLEVQEEFARVYAADQPVDCSLRPLS